MAFGDDDISAIVEQAGTKANAVGDSLDLFNCADSLLGGTFDESEMRMNLDDDDSSAAVQQLHHPSTVTPTPGDILTRNTSCRFFGRPTRMVSLGDEPTCIVVQLDIKASAIVAAPEEEFDFQDLILPSTGFVIPWDFLNEKSVSFQHGNAPPTNDHKIFPMAGREWQIQVFSLCD
jgi:hypothetical protein